MRRRVSTTFSVIAAVLVLLAGAASRVEAGACARPPGPVVAIVPSDADVIPRGEGVLVEIAGFAPRPLGPAETELGVVTSRTFDLGARLERDGESPIALVPEILGPALARLVPARTPSAGRWRIVGPIGTTELTFGDRPAAPLPTLPALVSARTTTTTTPQGPHGGGTSTTTLVELAAPVAPPAWQGVVVYQAVSGSREDAVLDRPLNGASATLQVFSTPGRCGFYVPGQSPPDPGRLVRVAAYDLWGRLSPRSNQVRVR